MTDDATLLLSPIIVVIFIYGVWSLRKHGVRHLARLFGVAVVAVLAWTGAVVLFSIFRQGLLAWWAAN